MKTLIVAPHADDEILGCFSVMLDKAHDRTVLLLDEIDRMRLAEAWSSCKTLGAKLVLSPPENIATTFEAVYVPCRQDTHPAHREANMRFREAATHFYSTEMGEGAEYLGPSRAASKKFHLDKYYPSQRSLWAKNDKLWMFEGIRQRDFETYQTWSFGTESTVQVTALAEYAEVVRCWWGNGGEHSFTSLVAVCRAGRVEMRIPAAGMHYVCEAGR